MKYRRGLRTEPSKVKSNYIMKGYIREKKNIYKLILNHAFYCKTPGPLKLRNECRNLSLFCKRQKPHTERTLSEIAAT